MIDLKTILKQHPNCLNSRASFKSVLMDKYPDEKRMVNILTIMFECGIVQKIRSKASLNDNDMQALLMQIESDYGILSKYAYEAVIAWATAFDVTIQLTAKQPIVTPKHESIVHAPIFDSVIVEGSKSDYETEKLKSGKLVIKKFIGFDEKEIVVPNSIDGISVKIIGENAFAKCTGIEKVVISEGISVINDGAFSGCSALKEVSLPTTLQRLGNPPTKSMYCITEGVFEGCAIESIQLPVSLNFIGNSAFWRCNKLQRIDLPNKIQNIQKYCFSGCTALKEVLLPDNLTNIGEEAFSNTGLTKIDIPVSVKKIERAAFRGCEQLTQVLLHEGLTTIEDSAFENCKMLRSITIPNSVTAIGYEVFDITGWIQPHDRRMKGWSTREKNTELVISCYAGSYGLEYARKKGFKIENAAK